MNKIITFFQEVKAELDKVTWATKDELIGSLVIVCVLSLFFALVLGFMDSTITFVVQKLIR